MTNARPIEPRSEHSFSSQLNKSDSRPAHGTDQLGQDESVECTHDFPVVSLIPGFNDFHHLDTEL